MQARANNLRAGSQPSYEGIRPGANHYRRILVDENNIDAPVGQYPMRIFTPRAEYRLRPKAQEVSC
jgi:hypothetical protein